jgi:hypothetical protein
VNSYQLASIAATYVFAGSMFGLWLNAWLPESCSLAPAACLFNITEMDTPFNGLIAILSRAMRDALAHMSQ